MCQTQLARQVLPFSGPFTSVQLEKFGFCRARLDFWLNHGIARRVARGVFAPAEYDYEGITQAMFGGHLIAPFEYSARQHQIWTPPQWPVMARKPLRRSLIHGKFVETDPHGINVSTPEWTALNLGRGQALPAALIPLDSVIRSGASVSTLSDLLPEIRTLGGATGLGQALHLATPLSESALESWERGIFHMSGIAEPTVQYETTIRGRRIRADFAWPSTRLIAEADGLEKYKEQHEVRHERERQNLLHEAGWQVVRFIWADVRTTQTGFVRKLAELLRASQH